MFSHLQAGIVVVDVTVIAICALAAFLKSL